MTLAIQELRESSKSMMPSTSPVIRPMVSQFPSVNPETHPQNVFFISDVVIHPPVPTGFKDIQAIVRNYENQPNKAAVLEEARKRLSNSMIAIDMPVTIANLRLRAGLSQSKTAMLLGNSQSGYSLIEAGRRDMLHKTFEKLVEIFNTTRDELAQAIKNTKAFNDE
jgi:hypothetical protein